MMVGAMHFKKQTADYKPNTLDICSTKRIQGLPKTRGSGLNGEG